MTTYYTIHEASKMRNMVLLAAPFALAIVGCGGGDESSAGSSNGDVDVPEFQGGQGQAPGGESYAPGPYGIGLHSAVPNYAFIGYVDSTTNQATMQEVNLGDYYNPHAFDPSYAPASQDEDDRIFPAGSVHGEYQPKPTGLLIDVSAFWCEPCRQESDSVLPGMYTGLKPLGAEFILNLADGPVPGSPANASNLISWTSQYEEEFPAVIDPEYKLAALFAGDFFPANIFINTTNMRVCNTVSGAPTSGDWNSFKAVLAGTDTCEQ